MEVGKKREREGKKGRDNKKVTSKQWKEKYVRMNSERGKGKHEARRRARKESEKSETERN
jgi:hypothetical protein